MLSTLLTKNSVLQVEDDVSKDQKRVNDAAEAGEKGMMQVVAAKLSDRDIKILSQFVSAVH